MRTTFFFLNLGFIFLFPFSSALHSQIVLTKNDLPNAGETFIYSQSSNQGTGFLPGKTGANYSWDFSKLKAQSQGEYNYVNSFTTPYLAYFFNTIGIKTRDTLNLILVKLSNIYDFHKKTDQKFSITGRGFSYQGLPLPANYIIEDKIYNFPVKYGDKDSTPFYYKLEDPTGSLPFSYAQSGWRVSKVDGWGTIVTPYGSFNCIRIKTKLITTDSITVFGFTIPINRILYEYRWMAPGQKIPLLQIDGSENLGNFNISQVRYKDVVRPLKPTVDFTYTDTKGEPGYEISFFSQCTNHPTDYIWEISPSTYTYMWGTNAGSEIVNIRFDSAGVYDVSLTASNQGGSTTRSRKKLISIVSAPVTGINNTVFSEFKTHVYPNPANDLIFFTEDIAVNSIIQVIDHVGKIVKNGTIHINHSFDLSSLPSGLYILKFQKNEKIVSERIQILR